MNKFEFNEVIKAVAINNPSLVTGDRYGSDADEYNLNGLTINFSGTYYAVVSGRIPLEVANIIYQKYPGNPYRIRVDGGCVDYNPNDAAIDDEYEVETNGYIAEKTEMEYLFKKFAIAREKLNKRENNNKYLNTYHIDTKEGLLIFITEMQDYFLRKQNMLETEVAKYDELLVFVYSEILKKVDPSLSAYKWMQIDPLNKKFYNDLIKQDEQSNFRSLFRTAILEFDKAINPFISDDIELDEMENYINKIKISADKFCEVNGKYRDNCCDLKICDNDNSNNYTEYYRHPDGFKFKLNYKFGDYDYLTLMHYFNVSSKNGKNLEREEVIEIIYDGKNCKKPIDLKFNLVDDKICESYEPKTAATFKQIAFIYDELLKATSYASSITIENMQKQDSNKKLQLS